MKYRVIVLTLLVLMASRAQATFSIVAVDTVTGACGSAGASCIANSSIIYDVVEGLGSINTQAYWLSANQVRADSLLRAGLTPDSILSYMHSHDAQSDPEIRQYGVVTLAGPGSSAAFTGLQTDDYKGHRVGPGYSIQGNILLGAHVLDTMEFAYLHTPGPLEERLMAALEAANISGADTRCLTCAKPAISAFIRVIHIGDGATPYLYQVVPNTSCSINPIPQLRALYDAWKALKYADADSSKVVLAPAYIPANGVDSAVVTITPRNYQGHPTPVVDSITVTHTGAGTFSGAVNNGDGTFSVKIHSALVKGDDTVTVSVAAGGQTTLLNQRPVAHYYAFGDANGDGTVNISDAVFLIAYVFAGGAAPTPLAAGDANCDSTVNISDAVFLIAYIFGGGAAPCT